MASRSFSALVIGLLLTGVCLFPVEKSDADEKHDGISSSLIHYYAPGTFTYDELTRMSETGEASASLRSKLHTLLNAPFISNEASASDLQVELAQSDQLGRFISIGSWNI
jgi:hypothetical protein